MTDFMASNILNTNIYNGQKQYWENVKKNYDAQVLNLQAQATDLGSYMQNLQATNPYSPDLQNLQYMASNIAYTQKQLQLWSENAQQHIDIAQQAAQRLGGGGGRGGW